jgi:hypothetical protein
MTRLPCVLLTCGAICFAVGGIIREVTYEQGGQIIPRFDKGYLLSMEGECQLAVFGPDGRLAFRQTLSGPGGEPCSFRSAAVDRDGSVAASISFSSPAGYQSGIVLMDRGGRKTSFLETGRYLPSHICFDREHSIWSIGWQRDSIQQTEDSQDYSIVRRYSSAGRETGAFLPRSMWPKRSFPGSPSRGYWTIAAADDRIGAVVNDNGVDEEWIEWDLKGNLLSRTKIPETFRGVRAYTSDGQLYSRMITHKPGRQLDLVALDPKTGSWVFKRQLPERPGLLLGADGKDLVFATSTIGPYRVVWLPTGE